MKDMQKSWLNAMFTIAQKTVDEISSDRTIKAIVKQVISTSEGKYLISRDSGSTFYAYTQSGTTDIYQVGEQVYILIPADDMSQKKFILGRATDNKEFSSSGVSTEFLLSNYVPIGDNIIIEKEYKDSNNLNVKRMQPFSLNSHKINSYYCCYLRDLDDIDSSLIDDYDTFTKPCIDIDEESFINSAKQAEALLMRAKFKANIDTDRMGNYGIIANIAFKDTTNPQVDADGNITYPSKLIAYVFDTNKMTGNPVKFYDYNSQYTILPFDGENYLYIDSIIAFSEGFVTTDTDPHSIDDDTNIYIDGLEIIALDEVTSINGDYKLKLTTPRGNTLRQRAKNELDIVATTTYLNQNITDGTTFYWGVKDPAVTSASDNYNFKLGPGYRYLSDEKENKISLSPSDLTAAENVYICVAVYESDIILRATVALYNNNNDISITIESDQGTNFQFNEGTPTLTCLINGKTSDYQNGFPSDAAFSFIWSKEDIDFGSILLNETEAQLENAKALELQQCREAEDHLSEAGRTISQVSSYYAARIAQIKNISYPDGIFGPKIKCALKNTGSYVTYSCSVYRAGIYVGYGSITLYNSKSKINDNYYITITNGAQVFQYDEYGIAPDSQRHKDPINVLNLVAVFHSPKGTEITPKSVRWVVPQEKTLINTPSLGLESDPETGERYFVGDIYPLSIKENYDNTCINNQVTAVVTNIDGAEYRQSSDLWFTKIGKIGTNGTDVSVRISPTLSDIPSDECLTIIKPFEGDAFYNNASHKKASNTDILSTSLYRNNVQISGHNTKWNIAGTSKIESHSYKIVNQNKNENICRIDYVSSPDNSVLDTRIIEAKTNFGGKYIYDFYGIPAIEYTDGYTYEDYPIKIKQDGTLKTILYDSNGTNPTFNSDQGVQVELVDWNKTGYIDWRVESDLKTNGIYQHPNILLATSPGAETGSRELKVSENLEDAEAFILRIQDISRNYENNAASNIQPHIQSFLTDVEKIVSDNLLSVKNKVIQLNKRLTAFIENRNSLGGSSVAVLNLYNEYKTLFDYIETEISNCVQKNNDFKTIYDEIQRIWTSEWPHVITSDRLSINGDSAEWNDFDIDKVIKEYQEACYGNRPVPDRNSLFKTDSQYFSLLENIDNYCDIYDDLKSSSSSALVEYIKILVAYISLIIEKTRKYLNDSNRTEVSSQYSFIYNDWNHTNNLEENSIGQIIHDVFNASEGVVADVFDKIRKIYEYYQSLYLGVQVYQIAEESNILNTWCRILNGYQSNLLNQIYVIPNKTFNGLNLNNNVVGRVFIKDNNNRDVVIASVYVPIIMTLNTYELAFLNGWDGTNVEIGDDHILTPQIGAGVKDDVTNTFTGMVMGAVNNSATNNSGSILDKINKIEKVGLIGYSNGKQSVFINAKTGETCFGLPEEDSSISEGRIELNPGGVSKIGNWKIGKDSLYNINGGDCEWRSDEDSRDSRNFSDQQKLMVPHSQKGIILSSNQPYVHIKSEPYSSEDWTNIGYQDEYNSINPEDSLELRLDPNNKSLFSIIQHTQGIGNQDDSAIFYGHRTSLLKIKKENDEEVENPITVISDYIVNQNSGIESASNYWTEFHPEYFVYRLINKPYYEEQGSAKFNIISFSNEVTNINNDSPYFFFKEEVNLQDALPLDEKDPQNDDFKNNWSVSSTGVISYRPINLAWKEGFSDWRSITPTTQFDQDNFSVTFGCNKNESIEKDFVLGTIKGDVNNPWYQDIYKIILTCNISFKKQENAYLNSTESNYIQFYIVENEEDSLNNEVLLKSNKFNFETDFTNTEIELFSVDGRNLKQNNSYILKVFFKAEYKIPVLCEFPLNRKSQKINKVKPSVNGGYGTLKIDGSIPVGSKQQKNIFDSTGKQKLTVWYELIDEGEDGKRFRLTCQWNSSLPSLDQKNYDFIIWRDNKNYGAGKAIFSESNDDDVDSWVNQAWYLDLSEGESGQLIRDFSIYDYTDENDAPSETRPIYISFYPEGYVLEEKAIFSNSYSVISIFDTDQKEYQLTENVEKIFTEEVTYSIDWDSLDYNNIKTEWQMSLQKIECENILGFAPSDIEKLCIQKNTRINSLQAIPYAKTYWDNDAGIWIVRFYLSYYRWVNGIDDTGSSNSQCYSYINIKINNNTCYKYIKTLRTDVVNKWFTEIVDGISYSENWSNVEVADNESASVCDWIDIPIKEETIALFDEAKNWQEFIRVGLDENGRLFSAGIQDRKTYSRTGRIQAFGKVPKLYGQEIRTQLNNNYTPIMKIFSNLEDSSGSIKTTYITQGNNDTGSISIRTAREGSIELGASQEEQNETNSIPELTDLIKVSYPGGIQIKNYHSDGNLNELVLSRNEGFYVNANAIFLSGGSKFNGNSSTYEIQDDYSWIKTEHQIISSDLSDSSPQRVYDCISPQDGHYLIRTLGNNDDPMIRFQVGSTTDMSIKKDDISLRVGPALNTFSLTSSGSQLRFDEAQISLSEDKEKYEKNIQLKNGKSLIKIGDAQTDITIGKHTNIAIQDGSITVNKGNSYFNGNVATGKKVFHYGDVYIGHPPASKWLQMLNKVEGGLYLCKSDGSYLQVLGYQLEKLYEWYNKQRWAIAVDGNTVCIKNVSNHTDLEGTLEDKTFKWKVTTFPYNNNARYDDVISTMS